MAHRPHGPSAGARRVGPPARAPGGSPPAGAVAAGRGGGALSATAAILGVATVLGAVILWPRGGERPDLAGLGFIATAYEAEVAAVREAPCPGGEQAGPACHELGLRLLEGPDSGERVPLTLPVTSIWEEISVGDRLVLGYQEDAPQEFRYVLLDRDRKPVLLWLAGLFALVVVVLGRLRGLAALAGLAASFVVLLLFVLPAILEGKSPALVAVVGASTIAFVTLYLAHGFSRMTTTALVGTVGSLALTAVLATTYVGLARFTGLGSEEAAFLQVGAGQIDLVGLLLGGAIIGALGAIDDMTVTQASAVWELREADPSMSAGNLFRAGMRIGRDHVASTVNTLVLAYAGASLPLLLLLILSRQSLGTVANSEVIASEIVRTLVGSIGLVAAVPLTTWLAARTAEAPAGRRDAVPVPRRGELPARRRPRA